MKIYVRLVSLLVFLSVSASAANSALPSPHEIYLQLGHSTPVQSVSYSPDGKFIASGSSDNTVRIWETATGDMVRTLKGHTSNVHEVNYSPDGKFIASGSGDNTVRIWDAATGDSVRTLSGHTNGVWSVNYSLDGKFIASGSDDDTVRIWTAETGDSVRTLSGHTDVVWSVNFSPDGKFIASASGDNTVKIWNAETGELVGTLSGHADMVWSVNFSPDGKFIASGGNDNKVRIWDVATGNPIRTLSGHSSRVMSVNYSPDGKFIASGSSDKTIRIWDTVTGDPVRTLSGHSAQVGSVNYSPDGEFILSGSSDNTVRIWNVSTGETVRSLSGNSSIVLTVNYSPDGKFIASGSSDNTVEIWDVATSDPVRTLVGHTESVLSVNYSPDGKFIASGSSDDTVRIWDAATGDPFGTLVGHMYHVNSVNYSPDGKFIASGSDDDTVRIWDTATGIQIRTLSGLSSRVISVNYSPDGKFIVSANVDNTVRIWDVATGDLVRTLSGHTKSVWSVNYSPDGKFIASGSEDNTVRIWDAVTGDAVRTLLGHASIVFSLNFSPDGKFIASGSDDNTVRIWDAVSGDAVRTLSGHSNRVLSVIFSPDGKFIASGGDNTISIWDVEKGKELSVTALLPGNEWLSYQPGKLYYNSSLQGDEYAAVRFENKTCPVYPLEYYRDTLKKKNWTELLSGPDPEIEPKRLRLFWDRASRETLWKYGIIGGALLVSVMILSFVILKKRSDPMEVSKQFFPRAGFEKTETVSENLLYLHAGKTGTSGMAAIWREDRDASEIVKAARKHARTSDGKFRLYLVHGDRKIPTEAVRALREDAGCEVIPVQSSRLQKAVSGQSDEKILTELKEIEDPFVARLDPYTESKPVKDTTWFYGRDKLMARLPGLLAQGQHVGVFGLRKVGKTSLIKQVQQRFFTVPACYIDCQAIAANADFLFREILGQIQAELSALRIKHVPASKPMTDGEDFRKQFTDMHDAWKKSGRQEPFLIILDEIDKLFPDRNVKESETTLAEYVRFFKLLRGMAQTSQCLVTMVVAYRPDVNRHNLLTPTVGENPMFQSFGEEYLGCLTHDESAEMIREIGLWKDIIWEEDAAQRVFHYCGGHPLVSRYFAGLACDGGTLKQIDMKRVENTATNIVKTFRKNKIGNYYAEGVWRYLTEDEQKTLALVCESGDTAITEDHIPEELEDALTNLEHFGLVVNHEGALCLSANFFDSWLKRKLGV